MRPLGSVVLDLGVEAGQAEDDEQYVLVVQLDVLCHFVRAVGEERLQALHEAVDVPVFHIGDELPDGESAFSLLHRSVVRQQEVHEPFLDLTVRESQFVDPRLGDESLDGEVSALVDHRDRVRG